MAYFDPSAGMFGASPGAGVGLESAVQNPFSPYSPSQASLTAQFAARAQRTAAENAALRAALLRHDNPISQETPGAGGGIGPAGWAVNLGHAIASVIAKKRQEAADNEARAGAAELTRLQAPEISNFWKDWSKNYQLQKPEVLNSVPQGTPLGF